MLPKAFFLTAVNTQPFMKLLLHLTFEKKLYIFFLFSCSASICWNFIILLLGFQNAILQFTALFFKMLLLPLQKCNVDII